MGRVQLICWWRQYLNRERLAGIHDVPTLLKISDAIPQERHCGGVRVIGKGFSVSFTALLSHDMSQKLPRERRKD